MASWDAIQNAYVQGVENGADDIVQFFVEQAKDVIKEEAFDEGTLHDSDVIDRLGRGRRRVRFTADHAARVHDGTPPGTEVPWDDLRGWVKRNLRIRPSRGFVFKPTTAEGTRSPRDREINAATAAVRQKIRDKGVDPVPYATIAMRKTRPLATKFLSRAITESLEFVAEGGTPGGA